MDYFVMIFVCKLRCKSHSVDMKFTCRVCWFLAVWK